MQTKKSLTAEGKKKAKELLEKQKEEDSKMVTGVFKNLEVPGDTFSFVYKMYKDEPYQRYELKDGETYTIPLGVARHINSIKKKERDYKVDSRGDKTLETFVSGFTQRVQFLSKEFM